MTTEQLAADEVRFVEALRRLEPNEMTIVAHTIELMANEPDDAKAIAFAERVFAEMKERRAATK